MKMLFTVLAIITTFSVSAETHTARYDWDNLSGWEKSKIENDDKK